MLTVYQRQLALSYAANVRKRMKHTHPGAAELVEWLADHADLLGVDFPAEAPETRFSRSEPAIGDWRRLAETIDQARQRKRAPARDPLAQQLQRLAQAIGLRPLDIAIVEMLLLYDTEPVVEDLLDAVSSGRRHRRVQPLNLRSNSLAWVLGKSSAALQRRVAPDAPLVRTGLVSVDEDQDLSVASRLRRLAGVVPKDADVRELLLGGGRQSDLEWSDFDHLGQSRDDVAMLLSGALRRRARGVNVLVYGPPGTGKTEFCHVLAQHVGAALFSIGETDDHGGDPSRRERLQELCLGQALLGEDPSALLLFDEMDDLLTESSGLPASLLGLFGRRPSSGASKVFMNRLLEDAPTPTVWTTNDTRRINPAILRRMQFALEMRQPPARIRARIWSRQLERAGIEASDDEARALAYEFDATPGVAAGATVAARLGEGGFDLVRRSVGSLSRVLGCDKPTCRPIVAFDPAFAAADIDLAQLADRLVDTGDRRFSLCLQGPPGTGKSAYARFLADRLGMETLHLRASDLLSMWVGETEQRIAAAFAQARDESAFLVFDEVDSLLADRRGAGQHWEISQVNEMLTWMESHPLPFACTTNYAERLDSAALRRFVFKATFRYMTPAMVRQAFCAWFGLDSPPGADRLTALTPGDFDVVRRKAVLLGQLGDAEALARMLKAEADAKPGEAQRLGFAA